MAKTTHVAVVSSPGFSHLVPIVEFSKRLVHHHPNFHVTCIIPSLGPHPDSSISYLRTLPPNINSLFLPPINKQDFPQGTYPGVLVQLTLTLSLPLIHHALKNLSSKHPLAALIADVFAFQTLDFAKEFNSSSYIYVPGSAMVLSFLLRLPKLDEEVPGEYKDLTEPLQIPGCVPLHGRDLPAPTQKRSSEAYKLFLERAKGMSKAEGIIINSFSEMESDAIKALAEEFGGRDNTEFYAVGPITQKQTSDDEGGSECLRWLDEQPRGSVLYVSFGSGGTLSQIQTNELALGLEMSGQRFLWVLRAPSDSVSSAYLDGGVSEDPLKFLPHGFLERTRGRGLVVPSWAPQVQVLRHSSVGGFVSHCGWNSTLESVEAGVPLIAWPLFAEQRMNAVMLVDGLRVAIRPKVREEDGVVEREEIAKVVTCLMVGGEGARARKKMEDLKGAAADAVKERGSSTRALSRLAGKWGNFDAV